MVVIGVSRRFTFYMAKLGYAFNFPLNTFSRVGRPPPDTQEQETISEAGSDEGDAQQRLDAVMGKGGADVGRTETWGGDAAAETIDADAATLLSELAQNAETDESAEDLRQEVDAAIETLKDLRAKLK